MIDLPACGATPKVKASEVYWLGSKIKGFDNHSLPFGSAAEQNLDLGMNLTL